MGRWPCPARICFLLASFLVVPAYAAEPDADPFLLGPTSGGAFSAEEGGLGAAYPGALPAARVPDRPEIPEALSGPGEDRVASVWRTSTTARTRAEALQRLRMEAGLGDLVVPASLISEEAASEQHPEAYSALALELAPETPAFLFEHALALWQAGDVGSAFRMFSRSLVNLVTRFEARLWLLDAFMPPLLIVFLVAPFAFLVLAAARVWSHAAHDLGDVASAYMPSFARHALLASLILAPMMLGEGVLGLALGLFALAFLYGDGRQRSAVATAAVMLIIGLHPLAQFSNVTATFIDADPIAGSVLNVANGAGTRADLERLDAVASRDLAAAHALAHHDRRQGRIQASQQRLESILERDPGDVVALANLGNLALRGGDADDAIAFYERAAAQHSHPTLLFNLSQAYALAFRLDDHEATLARAQRLGGREVARLSSLGDATLVADLGFPLAELLGQRLFSQVLSHRPTSGAVAALAPGWLGRSELATIGAFALVWLGAWLLGRCWTHASRCGRCGARICERCQETVWSEELCEDCHHLFESPQATDPALRMARLQALSEREVRFDRIWLTLSLCVPGMAGFAARRPDLALLGLLLFAWSATWVVWPRGPFAEPLLMGGAAAVSFAIPGLLAVTAYLGVVAMGLLKRKHG